MTNLLDGTEQFLRAARHPIPVVPTIPPAAVVTQRLKLLVEEVTELVQAAGFKDLYDYMECAHGDEADIVIQDAIDAGTFDLPEAIDAFHDITVVAHGGALETAGSDGSKTTAAEVTRSNLDKVNGKHGPILWSGRPFASKIMKPIEQGWQGPDIIGALTECGWRGGTPTAVAQP
ncbi:hypothetical protein CH274_13395 [Rhodococcus sp. 06-418-5]|uniref:hypothetical protein n=1 Tax=Rhodococcus sp. 06-418-5 TaxID=2022507 RepID=UPI000B9BFD57|nr:hypothetical protein [Rhodococcus sp. 06-418-5]OZC80224.1 hypothetical protein CH274_13395 [Rhodococcus sp. 06-418-5]